MYWLTISEIKKIKINYKLHTKKIKIYGWVKTKRISKIGITFLDIIDGSSITPLQIIFKKNNIKNYNYYSQNITNGSSIIIWGVIKYNFIHKKKEISANNIQIIGTINDSNKYPITPKYHTLKYLRTHAHLRSRTKIINTICKIRNSLWHYLHHFLHKKKFLWIPTPILTSVDTENNSKMFQIKTIKHKKHFFNKPAYLTVSGQLNLEAYACSLSKVYNFGPVFRAENSNTKKHLAEFWMLEIEIAYANLKYIITLSKDMLSYCIRKILNKHHEEINYLYQYHKQNNNYFITNIIKKKFIEINYTDIIKILKKKESLFKTSIIWGIDLSTEHEKYLTEKYFKSPIIIKNFPKSIKSFYMSNNTTNLVSSMDIIVPYIGEIIGGSEREHNLQKLDQNITEKKLQKKHYWWYRDLRKYGTIPHAGYGLGFERLLMYITKIQNIRDIVPFPRYPKYINF